MTRVDVHHVQRVRFGAPPFRDLPAAQEEHREHMWRVVFVVQVVRIRSVGIELSLLRPDHQISVVLQPVGSSRGDVHRAVVAVGLEHLAECSFQPRILLRVIGEEVPQLAARLVVWRRRGRHGPALDRVRQVGLGDRPLLPRVEVKEERMGLCHAAGNRKRAAPVGNEEALERLWTRRDGLGVVLPEILAGKQNPLAGAACVHPAP